MTIAEDVAAVLADEHSGGKPVHRHGQLIGHGTLHTDTEVIQASGLNIQTTSAILWVGDALASILGIADLIQIEQNSYRLLSLEKSGDVYVSRLQML